MKPSRWLSLAKQTTSAKSQREGSTIVVVIALLLALTFLGLVGYTIGTQEVGNAEYFSDASHNAEFGISRDELFDWGLRQVILGTYQDEERQKRAARRAHVVDGHDVRLRLTPYTGEGVHLHMNRGNIFDRYGLQWHGLKATSHLLLES